MAAELAVARWRPRRVRTIGARRSSPASAHCPPIGDISIARCSSDDARDKEDGRRQAALRWTAIGAWTIVDDLTERELKKALTHLGPQK